MPSEEVQGCLWPDDTALGTLVRVANEALANESIRVASKYPTVPSVVTAHLQAMKESQHDKFLQAALNLQTKYEAEVGKTLTAACAPVAATFIPVTPTTTPVRTQPIGHHQPSMGCNGRKRPTNLPRMTTERGGRPSKRAKRVAWEDVDAVDATPQEAQPKKTYRDETLNRLRMQAQSAFDAFNKKNRTPTIEDAIFSL